MDFQNCVPENGGREQIYRPFYIATSQCSFVNPRASSIYDQPQELSL